MGYSLYPQRWTYAREFSQDIARIIAAVAEIGWGDHHLPATYHPGILRSV